MAIELVVCYCNPVCSDRSHYVYTHFSSWAEQGDLEQNETYWVKIETMLTTSKRIAEIKNRLPPCTCKHVYCNDEITYINKHLEQIAGDGCDKDIIEEHLWGQSALIRKTLNDSFFRRGKIQSRDEKRNANIAAGRPAVQPLPPLNPNKRNETCNKGLHCGNHKCKRLHPDDRQLPERKPRIVACRYGMLCPRRHSGCEFHHDPRVYTYDGCVILNKRILYPRDNRYRHLKY
jgi:hypothetical protein